MQGHFSFLGDDHNDSAGSGDALKEAAALIWIRATAFSLRLQTP
jgi:hypothetical protein